MFFSTTLFRVATPFRHMSWADFLLADVLTSLAKPLSDCERALCHLLSGPVMLPHSTDEVGCVTCLYHADVWEQLLDHSSRSESPILVETLPVLANLERHRQHSSGVQCSQVQHSIPCHHVVCSQLSGFRR